MGSGTIGNYFWEVVEKQKARLYIECVLDGFDRSASTFEKYHRNIMNLQGCVVIPYTYPVAVFWNADQTYF